MVFQQIEQQNLGCFQVIFSAQLLARAMVSSITVLLLSLPQKTDFLFATDAHGFSLIIDSVRPNSC
jgi:hypothetical protein